MFVYQRVGFCHYFARHNANHNVQFRQGAASSCSKQSQMAAWRSWDEIATRPVMSCIYSIG